MMFPHLQVHLSSRYTQSYTDTTLYWLPSITAVPWEMKSGLESCLGWGTEPFFQKKKKEESQEPHM